MALLRRDALCGAYVAPMGRLGSVAAALFRIGTSCCRIGNAKPRVATRNPETFAGWLGNMIEGRLKERAMGPQMEIPEGYVLVRKGGRPKSTLRDLAVHIAYQIKKDQLGKGYLANEWIIENFKLNDAGHIRKCRANARNVLTKRWMGIRLGTAVFLFPATITHEGLIVVEAGTVGWGWTEGYPTALEIKMTSGFSKAGPTQSQGGARWELQDKKQNW